MGSMASPLARDASLEQLLCQSSLGRGKENEQKLLRMQLLLGEVRRKLLEIFVFCQQTLRSLMLRVA